MTFTSFSGTPVLLRGLSHGFRFAGELAQVNSALTLGCSIVPIMFLSPVLPAVTLSEEMLIKGTAALVLTCHLYLWFLGWNCQFQFSSVAQLCPTLRPNGLQHARPPCPSLTPGAYWNSFPLSRWCHPTISSSVIPFSRLQSFPASGSFQISQFFTSGGQSIGVSASASVLPMNKIYMLYIDLLIYIYAFF